MSYRVIVIPRAQREIADIHDWLFERSVSGAAAWSAALRVALDRLKTNPMGYAVASENDAAPIEIREFLFKTRRGRTYRGVFSVSEHTVHVLHIRGPGQQMLRPEDFDE